MTLEALRQKLVAAQVAAGLTELTVLFDYSSVLNNADKSYPIALWDFDNITGTVNFAAPEKFMTINCWCINDVSPDDDVVARHKQWDTIEAVLQTYLGFVNQQTDVTVENIRAMPFEYFPAGLLSPEREMAVRYSVDLKLWC